MGQFTYTLTPTTFGANASAEGSWGSFWRLRIVLLYFDSDPKQFSPIAVSSVEAIGRTFSEGKPG